MTYSQTHKGKIKKMEEQIIYKNRLSEAADDFIMRDLDGDASKLEGTGFLYMIEVIKDELPYIDRNDTESLDKAFDAFTALCLKYNRIPSLSTFARLIKAQPATLSRWRSGAARAGSNHSEMVERWSNVCESLLIDALANDPKTSINRIFLAKAIYGYRDNDPMPQVEQIPDQNKILPAEALPRLSVND